MNTNIETVLEILKNEVSGDVKSALDKMSADYLMTWMYQSSKELFPHTTKNVSDEMQEAYVIKNRSYDIRNIAEGPSLVMVELIESYPDPKTGAMYRTPLVLVLEFNEGKIRTGRHYCDPKLSYMNLESETIEKALPRTPTKILIN